MLWTRDLWFPFMEVIENELIFGISKEYFAFVDSKSSDCC